MNITVLIKQVPGTTNVSMNPETGTMIRDASDTVLNPLDENAVAEAVKIKRNNPGSSVTVLTMGPGSALKVLQEACARGADRGILLSHKSFGGSDTIATSRVLAAAIKKLGDFDLILAGEKSIDGETGQTGPMTAALLDIPVITFVRQLSVKEGLISAQRLVEDGVEEIETSAPALVTVVKDINKPSLPSLRGYVTAKKMKFPVWGPEDLGLDEAETGLKGSPTRVSKVFSPKFSRNTSFIRTGAENSFDDAARAVIEALTARKLLNSGDKNAK